MKKPEIKRLMVRVAAVVACLVAMRLSVRWHAARSHNTLVPGGGIGIAREVPPYPSDAFVPDAIPAYNANSDDVYDLYLCEADLTGASLSGLYNELMQSAFDTNTLWPDRLPAGFDPAAVMEAGFDPGLGVRALHARGIDGRGIGIGIVDQVLFTGHEEYRDNLRHYEELHIFDNSTEPGMHGSATASIAAGRKAGVAPGASLYYIGMWHYDWLDRYDMGYLADGVNRLLSLNAQLHEGERIRVISLSYGWTGYEKRGRQELLDAIARADAQGVLVITSNIDEYYPFSFAGLDRLPGSDFDNPNSYRVGIFQRQWANQRPDFYDNCLFVPMDRRSFAGITAPDAYTHNAVGGYSWAAPYVAGLYALGCQVYPELTPTLFFEQIMSTADSLTVDNLGVPFTLRHVVNPSRFVAALEAMA